MAYLLALLFGLVSCEGATLKIVPGNHVLLQSHDMQLSCYSGTSQGSNCCYPYQNKLMICTYASFSGIGNEGGSIIIRYIWDKESRKIVDVTPSNQRLFDH